MVIRVADVAALRWLEASIAMSARELISGRVSSRAMMAQLSELLLVEALRAYVEADERPKGWLAGIADKAIARSLVHIHGSLDRDLPLESLAAIAGMSRTTFIQRFTELIGLAPGRYVLQQRIEAAKLLLRDTQLGSAEIAYRVGYEAPEAFHRAFRRQTGATPAAWRTGQGR
jgi:transcriptional regulator GlxA family with amidase domain